MSSRKKVALSIGVLLLIAALVGLVIGLLEFNDFLEGQEYVKENYGK